MQNNTRRFIASFFLNGFILLSLMIGMIAPCLANDSDDMRAGLSLYKEGKFTEAITLLSTLPTDEGPGINAMQIIAKCHYALGEYETAATFYEKFIFNAALPDDFDLFSDNICMGVSYMRSAQYEKAIKHFERISKVYHGSTKHPEDEATSYARLAIAYYFNRQLVLASSTGQTAIDLWDKIIKEYPKYRAQGLFETGDMLSRMVKDYPAAISILEQFIEEYPENEFAKTDAVLFLIGNYRLTKQSEKSRTFLSNLLTKAPSHYQERSHWQYLIGLSWYQESKWVEANTAYNQLLKEDSKSDWATFAKGDLVCSYLKLGNKETAQTFLNELQRDSPNHVATKIAVNQMQITNVRNKGTQQ